jgi:hypothetical protein
MNFEGNSFYRTPIIGFLFYILESCSTKPVAFMLRMLVAFFVSFMLQQFGVDRVASLLCLYAFISLFLVDMELDLGSSARKAYQNGFLFVLVAGAMTAFFT